MADRYNITCPHCGDSLEAQDDWGGMETTCPFCSKNFIIPQREVPASSPAEYAAPPAYSHSDTWSEQEEESYEEQNNGWKSSGLSKLFLTLGGLCVTAAIIFARALDTLTWTLIVIGIIFFILGKFFSPKGKEFRLGKGEKILFTTRLKDDNSLVYYTRVTNCRVVLSAIEYPTLPIEVAACLEMFSKPKKVTYSWLIDDISVELQKSLLSKKMYIEAGEDAILFDYNSAFWAWIESMKNGQPYKNHSTLLWWLLAAFIIIFIVTVYVVNNIR